MIFLRNVKAIDYAVTEWKVDIISMSFGRTDLAHDIDNVLTQHADNTLFFVAASNHAGRKVKVSWPARREGMICIFATDGNVNPYDDNPSPRAGTDNLAFLGVSVEGAWPQALNPLSRSRLQTGTSCATPIAAGVAACILTFTRRQVVSNLAKLPEAERAEYATNCGTLLRKLQKPQIIKKVMRDLASSKRGGYDCVAPWLVFERKGVQDSLQEIFHRIKEVVDS